MIRLDDEILALCGPTWLADLPPTEGLPNDYRLLANKVMRLVPADELFTFVMAKPVEQLNRATQTVGATNNEAERTLRSPRPSPQDGSHQENARRCPPTNDCDKRPGIASAVPTDAHAHKRDCGDSLLDADGAKLLRGTGENAQDLTAEVSVLDQVIPQPSG